MTLILIFLLLGLTGQGAAPPAAQAAPECPDFAKNLDSCTASACTFRHPFTGETMERRILGLRGDVCAYVEQMPNGGSMECSYTPAMRRSVAAFFTVTQEAQSVGTRARSGSGQSSSQTTIDGRPVANPLNEALRSGACTIKGYGADSAPAPAVRPAAASGRAGNVPATTTGTMTVGGKATALTHAFAVTQPDPNDRTKQAVLVVLSDVALTPAQAADPLELQKMMRANQLHAVAVVIRDSKAIATTHLYDPAFTFAVFVAPSNSRYEPETADAGTIGGRLSTVRPGAFTNVPYEFSATFAAPIPPPAGAARR